MKSRAKRDAAAYEKYLSHTEGKQNLTAQMADWYRASVS